MSWICPRCQSNELPSVHQCAQGEPRMPAAGAAAAERLRQGARRLGGYDGTTQSMAAHIEKFPGMRFDVLTKYDTAIQKHADDGEYAIFKSRYRDFELGNLTKEQNIEIINEIWKETITYEQYGQTVASMDDPGRGNFNSSITRPYEGMFKNHGYCFRCDTREPGSVSRYGFKPLYNISPPYYAVGTILQDRTNTHAGFWSHGTDIVSETSVCVSRSLRGAGKFPNPGDIGKAYFYAFKLPLFKQGFDTEHKQVITPGLTRWQPGEKAFPVIASNNVLAWTPIFKHGMPNEWADPRDCSFSYRILEATWHRVNGDDDDIQYLNAELAALNQGHANVDIIIRMSEDFALAAQPAAAARH